MHERARFADIRRRRGCWIIACVGLLGTLLLFYLSPWSSGQRQLLVLLGLLGYTLATLWAIAARCPSCGRLFHNVLGFANPFSSRCAGCGRSLDGERE